MTPQSSTALYARLLSYVRPYAKTFALTHPVLMPDGAMDRWSDDYLDLVALA